MDYVVLVADHWLGVPIEILFRGALNKGSKLVSVLRLPMGWWRDAPAVPPRVSLFIWLPSWKGLPPKTEILSKSCILT